MQALILVGGEGTRLRPLTSDTPKPVLPLAGRPFITFMLEWLRGHGVDDVIMSCGFLADGVRAVLGDGDGLGVRLRYLDEPSPLGTGGALKFAEELLDERFFMLNGDVLTDMDLTAQMRHHEETGARATIALVPVEDPSAYGLVRRAPDTSVREFVEKPSEDQIDTNLVNAGAYILERSVLARMGPPGTRISIEREVFPALVGAGLYGFEQTGYWLDIGTPERYMQGTYDILDGVVSTEVGRRLAAAGGHVADNAQVDGRLVAPAWVGEGSEVAAEAVVGPRTVLGRRVRVEAGAHVEGSVVLDGAVIGERTVVHGSVVGAGARVGELCHLDGRVVLGAEVVIGNRNVLSAGARIFPGVTIPDGAIAF